MTKTLPFACLLLTILLFTGCCSTPATDLQTVDKLDLQRYGGKWYEIARFPHSFEKNLVGVTAEYTLNDDGTVAVRNSGHVKTLDGKLKVATAKAWVSDPAEPARLCVRFFWPFTAPYWVIALDDDYQWSVVSAPKRNYLWILSRSRQMDDALYRTLVAELAADGFDVARLELVPQPAAAQ